MIFNTPKKYRDLSDEEILHRYKKKPSSSAIAELYTRYSHLVMGVSMKYMKNKFDAEDIMMNIFEILPKKIMNHNIKNFKSWLYMVTKNECLMLLRKKGPVTTDLVEVLSSTIDETDQLEIKISVLEKEIDLLNDIQKVCIRLFYLERKSYNQIVELTQIDLKQVKSALQNGKRNLRLKLENTDGFKTTI